MPSVCPSASATDGKKSRFALQLDVTSRKKMKAIGTNAIGLFFGISPTER